MTISQNNETRKDVNANKRFRQFNWEKAKHFYYVAKAGSFSGASEFMNITQSALSRSIFQLEKSLESTPLFIRHPRGVNLTRKGEELFAVVEGAFLGINGFTRNLYPGTNKGRKRKIRFVSTYELMSYLLDKQIFSYNKDHPHLIFELLTDNQMTDVVMNDVDIAIRPFNAEAIGIQQEHLFTLEKKLYASSQYLEKYGEPQTVEDLRDHHFIVHAQSERTFSSDLNWMLKLGMPKDKSHEPVLISASLESAIKAAKEGIGIVGCYEGMTIIQKSGLKNILPHVKSEALKKYFVYPDHLKDDDEIMRIKTYLQENIS